MNPEKIKKTLADRTIEDAEINAFFTQSVGTVDPELKQILKQRKELACITLELACVGEQTGQ